MELALILSILAMVAVHTISLLSLLSMDKGKKQNTTHLIEYRDSDITNKNKDLKD